MDEELALYYDEEEGVWKRKPEPYCVIEIPTEEDYKKFQEMVEFWNEHHPDQQ